MKKIGSLSLLFLFLISFTFAETSVAQGTASDASEICSDNSDCSSEFYCEKPIGNCDGNGNCSLKPTICPFLYDPVCGCDGNTHANECVAASAGISVAYHGECSSGCLTNYECDQGYYCVKPMGDCDGEGVCTLVPECSTCPYYFWSVCGCDGITYAGDCWAACVGEVSVAYPGPCISECLTWDDVVEKYKAYENGQATLRDVIECYREWRKNRMEE